MGAEETPQNIEAGSRWSEKQAESALFERIARDEGGAESSVTDRFRPIVKLARVVESSLPKAPPLGAVCGLCMPPEYCFSSLSVCALIRLGFVTGRR
jgi:hypothetical protein